MAANDNCPQKHHLYITENKDEIPCGYRIGREHLSIIHDPKQKRKTEPKLSAAYAANGTIIPTYDSIVIQPDFGLRRAFPWRFIVTDTTQPILRADFLSHYHGHERKETNK